MNKPETRGNSAKVNVTALMEFCFEHRARVEKKFLLIQEVEDKVLGYRDFEGGWRKGLWSEAIETKQRNQGRRSRSAEPVLAPRYDTRAIDYWDHCEGSLDTVIESNPVL